MNDIDTILKRVNKNGIAFVTPSKKYHPLVKKEDIVIFRNRRNRKSVVINEKKLKELLGTDLL